MSQLQSVIKFYNPKQKTQEHKQNLLQLSHEYVYLEPDNKSIQVRAPHSHWFAEIFFISNGSGKFVVNGVEHFVEEGDLVFINPNILHTELNEFNLTYFCLSIFNIHFEVTPESCVLHSLQHCNKIKDLLDSMLLEFNEKKEYSDEFIANYFEHFCLLIQRFFSFSFNPNSLSPQTTALKTKDKNHAPVEIARGYMENNLHYDITLESLANMTFITPQHLIRLFKEATGYTPIQYLNRLRISRSMYLLMRRKDPISSIATQMGFKSSYAYIKMFKKTTGYTPQQFRTIYINNFNEADQILASVSEIHK